MNEVSALTNYLQAQQSAVTTVRVAFSPNLTSELNFSNSTFTTNLDSAGSIARSLVVHLMENAAPESLSAILINHVFGFSCE